MAEVFGKNLNIKRDFDSELLEHIKDEKERITDLETTPTIEEIQRAMGRTSTDKVAGENDNPAEFGASIQRGGSAAVVAPARGAGEIGAPREFRRNTASFVFLLCSKIRNHPRKNITESNGLHVVPARGVIAASEELRLTTTCWPSSRL